MIIDFLKADWPAPECIIAGTTTRHGGHSLAPYDSFNLATHVGDDREAVANNRKLLVSELDLPDEPIWLNQVHSTTAVNSDDLLLSGNPESCADAIFSFDKNKICAVLTADCVPILITDSIGSRVAAIHAGWRGLRDGIIEKTLSQLNCNAENLLVWIGPAISSEVFEVDDNVRDEFIKIDEAAANAYKPSRAGHWLMDLVLLVKQRLNILGVSDNAIFGGDRCSYLENDLFYSYRRNSATGRMASLIYIRETQ
ncbi:MAG: peptidoglycan editing factor PgeF [Gammaproteobacteria bacterium]